MTHDNNQPQAAIGKSSMPEQWAAATLNIRETFADLDDVVGCRQCLLVLGRKSDPSAYQIVLDLPAERRSEVQQGLRRVLASIIRDATSVPEFDRLTLREIIRFRADLLAEIAACEVSARRDEIAHLLAVVEERLLAHLSEEADR